MALVCTIFVFVVIAVVLYSICAVSSRRYYRIENRTLLFLPRAVAMTFETLLAEGDVESVCRIMKGLHQRGDIHIIETENEIIITRPEHDEGDLREIKIPHMRP
jgi:uncharacterized protein YqhQ